VFPFSALVIRTASPVPHGTWPSPGDSTEDSLELIREPGPRSPGIQGFSGSWIAVVSGVMGVGVGSGLAAGLVATGSAVFGLMLVWALGSGTEAGGGAGFSATSPSSFSIGEPLPISFVTGP